MQGKLIPVPSENLGAVRTALSNHELSLKRLMQHRDPIIAKAAQIDLAAIVWAKDNLDERPEVNIYDGH